MYSAEITTINPPPPAIVHNTDLSLCCGNTDKLSLYLLSGVNNVIIFFWGGE